jgi:hypothetical protein
VESRDLKELNKSIEQSARLLRAILKELNNTTSILESIAKNMPRDPMSKRHDQAVQRARTEYLVNDAPGD